MMKRRTFLQVTGIAVAGSALGAAGSRLAPTTAALPGGSFGLAATPSSMQLSISEPGTYLISGLVRLQAAHVEIGGINNSQSISWAHFDGPELPVASFTIFETFTSPGAMPEIRVQGGRLESLTAVPVESA